MKPIRLQPFDSSIYLPTAEELPDSDDTPLEGGELQKPITLLKNYENWV